MEIKILGAGCVKCGKLFSAVKDVVSKQGLEATVEKVEQIDEIMKFDVFMTPALVIDGEVVSTGKLLSTKKITKLLMER